MKSAASSIRSARPAEGLVPDAVLDVIRDQMHSLFSSANKIGLPALAIATLAGDEIRNFLPIGLREGFATAEEGLDSLLEADGGCVSVVKACGLFRKPRPVSRQALNARIRAHEIIAYKTGGGEHLVPVWQFRPEGGLLRGMDKVLWQIKKLIPGADALTPFAFFLQAHPLTDGKRPIDALRAGEIENILEAVKANAG
jgi:hypothetical protein